MMKWTPRRRKIQKNKGGWERCDMFLNNQCRQQNNLLKITDCRTAVKNLSINPYSPYSILYYFDCLNPAGPLFNKSRNPMTSVERISKEEAQRVRQIHEDLAIRFFQLCFKLCTFNQQASKDNEDVVRFIEIYHQKSEEIRCFANNQLSGKESLQPLQDTDRTNQILKALEIHGSKRSFIRFLSENHDKIFKEKEYNGFKCTPQIICWAILSSEDFYCAGSERSAQKVIRILIGYYQQKPFNLDKQNASRLYSIGAHLSFVISDHKTAYARLRSALRIYKDSMAANFQSINYFLRDFKFQNCHQLIRSNESFFRDKKIKAIKLLTAACVDPSRPEREDFILMMQEGHEYPKGLPKGFQVNYQKYYDFDNCCGYFQYLSLEYQHAHSYFKKQFDLRKREISIEGMCLCSYRLKDYGRALDQFNEMSRIMPYQRGWKLTIAAVCYFKLGDEKKALAMLAEVDKVSLSFEEDVFYCGVLCSVGQQEKAIKRLSAVSHHPNSIIRTQMGIVMLLCEQKQGNTAYVNRILKYLPYLEQSEQSIDHRYMEFQQALFLANYYFQRNRLAEGRTYVKKVRRMGESLRKIATTTAVQRLMEELNQQRQVEVELIFR